MKHRYKGGYLTVEAAFLMPFVVFLFVFLIFISLFLYDRTVLFQDTYALAFRGSRKPMQVTEMKTYLDHHAAEQFGEKYFAVNGFSHSISVTKKKVTIDCNMNVAFLRNRKNDLGVENRFGIEESISVDVKNPTKITRELRTGERLIQTISGGGTETDGKEIE